MYSPYTHRGLSIVEIIIVLAILGALSVGAFIMFNDSRSAVGLKRVSQDVAFHLEEVRAEALAGKNGEPQGVKFNSDSYVQFSGATYSGSDPENNTIVLTEGFTLTTDAGGDEVVVFDRLTGSVSGAPVIITLTHTLSGATGTVTVGTEGDISISE